MSACRPISGLEERPDLFPGRASNVPAGAGEHGPLPGEADSVFRGLVFGICWRGQTATQALYQNYFQPFVYNETTALQLIDDAGSGCSPCSNLGPNAFYSPQFAGLSTLTSAGGGSYHAMQWTVSKRLGSGLQFDFNYTWSKSIDLGSYGEAYQDPTLGAFTGLIQNAWSPGQNKGVSDYDTTNLFSAFMVWNCPGKRQDLPRQQEPDRKRHRRRMAVECDLAPVFGLSHQCRDTEAIGPRTGKLHPTLPRWGRRRCRERL